MEQLDELYRQLLNAGFLVLRQAIDARDWSWVHAETELLHNVPSLIGETNPHRHRYFWHAERTHYIQWASMPGHSVPCSRMKTYYEPVWREMEPVLLHAINEVAQPK